MHACTDLNRFSFSIHSLLSSVFLYTIKKNLLSVVILFSLTAGAQNAADTAYQKVIAERATKIVNTLDISDATKVGESTEDIMANQYLN